jgi:hypothetical protein
MGNGTKRNTQESRTSGGELPHQQANELGPICKEHVDKRLVHVLTLKVPQRREILLYHFQLATVGMDGVSNPIYKLSLAETGIALQRLMPGMSQLPTDQSNNGSIESNGDGESVVGIDVVEENGVETTAGVVNDR